MLIKSEFYSNISATSNKEDNATHPDKYNNVYPNVNASSSPYFSTIQGAA